MLTPNPTVEQGEGAGGRGMEGTSPLDFRCNKTGQIFLFFFFFSLLSLED